MIRWMLCASSLTAKRHCCEEQLRLNRHAECSSDGSHWGRPGGKKTKGLGGAREGGKLFHPCALMGERISSELAASRQEFDAALDGIQMR